MRRSRPVTYRAKCARRKELNFFWEFRRARRLRERGRERLLLTYVRTSAWDRLLREMTDKDARRLTYLLDKHEVTVGWDVTALRLILGDALGGNGMIANKMRAIHPGEILREEYLKPMGIDVTEAAHRSGIDGHKLYHVVREEDGIYPEMAAALSAWLGTTPEYWLNLQDAYYLAKNEGR